jgi:hypothetical protein
MTLINKKSVGAGDTYRPKKEINCMCEASKEGLVTRSVSFFVKCKYICSSLILLLELEFYMFTRLFYAWPSRNPG